MGPSGSPCSLQSLQTGSWKNCQKPAKVRILTKVGFLITISICGAWLIDEVKFHFLPSFMNLDWQVEDILKKLIFAL